MTKCTFISLVAAAASLVTGAAFAQSPPLPQATNSGTAQTGTAPTPAAPAPVRAVPPPPPPLVTSDSYRINSGDELEIYVWGEERLQRTVKVLPDGTITFPLIGQFLAQGKLPHELQATIGERLASQYRGQVPQVTVSVRATSGMQFSIMGRVRSPGTFTPGRYVNILEALSMAGGPNDFANLNDIVILRKNGGEIRAVPIRIAALFKSGVRSGDINSSRIVRIESGDTVIVP